MALPHLTKQEKIEALRKAQEMRSKRADLRSKLKKGSVSLEDVLATTDNEVISKMRLAYLMQSLPQVGKVTSKRIMEEIGINENRRVQGLGKRQIVALLDRLG